MLRTREVRVGRVLIGGNNPVRIQSMTSTDTANVEATVEEILRLEAAGCEIVRMAVQSNKEALAVEEIKNSLAKRGSFVPLVADIHFFPEAAMRVAPYVDKIRINPGNFCRSDAMEKSFLPLIELCKSLKKALRIGVNHGSLSKEILEKFGNTARGMVESAIFFGSYCVKEDFHDLVFSMKASDPKVMIEAYRLLVDRMEELGWDYPLHLGVTEAGLGWEGRIKSAIGIGSLLLDGIGDTIRVSLTEDPVNEIEPARRLIKLRDRAEYTRSWIKRSVGEGEEVVVDFKEERLRKVRGLFQEKRRIVLKFDYGEEDDFFIAAECGSLLLDGLGDDLILKGKEALQRVILQVTGLRREEADFISCPGCGRTLYDLREVAKEVKERTKSFKGLKIAVMGCIVNGSGEMGDADYGVIGSKKSRVNLYAKGKLVEKDVDEKEAVERLISIILK